MPQELSPRRDLPWRRTRDPWAVLVSEVMLQQTQVERVVPHWEEWMARFPTPAACAGAPLPDVLRLWGRLGYPRRARNLHRAARAVTEQHDGVVPAELDALLALPGVGPYTARAVLAFAFEHDVAVVDSNVARVLARLAGRPLTASDAQERADALVPPGKTWAHNQAMIDIGATICGASAPRCSACPWSNVCAWHAAGHPAPDPAARRHRQAPFAGSDRQGRGRLMAALRAGPIRIEDAATVMGWPDDAARAERVAATLVADGLVDTGAAGYELAKGPVIS